MGKVYQLSAFDVFSRWAIVMIVIGPVDHTHRRHGVRVKAVLTDHGPEYVDGTFRAHLVAKQLSHQRILPRSPNHNAVCERFHQTILQECWRPAFHRRHFTSIRQLQAEADSWLVARDLSPPPEEPRGLHAGQDPSRGARQPSEEQGSITIITVKQKVHLSLQLSVRKP